MRVPFRLLSVLNASEKNFHSFLSGLIGVGNTITAF